VLKKIQKDMEFAAQHCSDNADRGRVTKGAAAHLLTKINLALGEFDKAIASASAVIDGGVYSLMTTPFGSVPQKMEISLLRWVSYATMWCQGYMVAEQSHCIQQGSIIYGIIQGRSG
jgi:hypothetical protein